MLLTELWDRVQNMVDTILGEYACGDVVRGVSFDWYFFVQIGMFNDGGRFECRFVGGECCFCFWISVDLEVFPG